MTYTRSTLPAMALSVRQPWAHALAMGWKGIENRDWRRPNPGLTFTGAFCIHASTGLTRAEYDKGAAFMAERGFICPPAIALRRGGIIGTARVRGIVRASDDPWFFGPVGLVIVDAAPFDFIPAAVAPGFFRWGEAMADYPPGPAKWMREPAVAPDLFSGGVS